MRSGATDERAVPAAIVRGGQPVMTMTSTAPQYGLGQLRGLLGSPQRSTDSALMATVELRPAAGAWEARMGELVARISGDGSVTGGLMTDLIVGFACQEQPVAAWPGGSLGQ